MAKSLREIAQDFENFLGGRKLDLSDHDFDNLTILNQSQQGNQGKGQRTTEYSVEEIRAMLAGRKWEG